MALRIIQSLLFVRRTDGNQAKHQPVSSRTRYDNASKLTITTSFYIIPTLLPMHILTFDPKQVKCLRSVIK